MGERAEREEPARRSRRSPASTRSSTSSPTIANSRERIPAISKLGAFVYNFWQDEANPRGLWRRTTLDEYRKAAPAWETVLDLDKLSAAENEKWAWKGATCLYPKYERCLVSLSRGGGDAVEIREFDLARRRRSSKGGFRLPEVEGRRRLDRRGHDLRRARLRRRAR